MDFDPQEDRCVQAEAIVRQKPLTATKANSGDGLTPMRNKFRYMLQNVTKAAEIDLIFSGIIKLLSTVHQANQTYLPNSFRSVGFYQEALVLLWHLMTLNQSFTKRLVENL